MLRIIHIFLLLLIISNGEIFAQKSSIKGIITDVNNNRRLAFVNIITNSGIGATTDIDGKFELLVFPNDSVLKISYVGYESAIYTIDFASSVQQIKLHKKTFNLDEVNIYPGENPAHRIINNAIKNKNTNNPNKLKAFTYTSYDKMTITIKADSLMSVDTTVLDTSQLKIRKFFDKQDLFLMETVAERKYMYPELNQETVIATRISGFKDPLITFMVSQLQSTSFYNEQIKILGNEYINPVSKNSIKKYFFLIEDTIYHNNTDTVFIISFRPSINTRFNGMKGFLHINSNKWAIERVKAEPQNDSINFRIRIQQAYDLIEDHWFPTQLNTDIIFKTASVGNGDTTFPLVAEGKSYIRDINLTPDLKKSDFGFNEIQVDEDAGNKKGEFWHQYRTDSLSAKNLETYRVIDSIGKQENFDKIASTFQTLMTGQIPFRYVNLDIDRFIHFNNYEGLYLGIGAHTNQKLSKKVTFGGYWGYGFRDKTSKYGGDLSWLFHKPSSSTITINAYNNVTASGKTTFFANNNQIWQTSNFYEFFFTQMNKTVGGSAVINFKLKALRNTTWYVGMDIFKKYPYQNYYFNTNNDANDNITTFNVLDYTAGIRFAYREKILQTTRGNISLGSDYPIVLLKYTHGSKLLGDDYLDFDRIDLSFSYTYNTKYAGSTKIAALAGWVSKDLPISELFSNRASYANFTVYAPQSFGTMRANEFYSDKYFSLFLTHNFKDLLFGFGNYRPELMIVTNIGFGGMNNTDYHHNINFKTLEKGYYESGFVLRKLLNLQLYDLGFGVLYRYGPYGYTNISNNFAYKLSLFFAL